MFMNSSFIDAYSYAHENYDVRWAMVILVIVPIVFLPVILLLYIIGRGRSKKSFFFLMVVA